MESANTNVIGRRGPVAQDSVAIIAKEYRSNSLTKRRAHWSLKTRGDMLPNNISHEQNNYLYRLSFFKGDDVDIIIGGVDGMAELELFYVSIRKRRLVEEEERVKEKER